MGYGASGRDMGCDGMDAGPQWLEKGRTTARTCRKVASGARLHPVWQGLRPTLCHITRVPAVIPAQAGIQRTQCLWIPAYAGMTNTQNTSGWP